MRDLPADPKLDGVFAVGKMRSYFCPWVISIAAPLADEIFAFRKANYRGINIVYTCGYSYFTSGAGGYRGVYRSRISATSFTPAEDLAWGQKYFWRVDEINADGTTTVGKVWTFTVADYLIVDDFEAYTDVQGEAIFDTWVDGWTNGTGSVVGNVVAPFAERTIVFSGSQAMPLDYNNINTPWYSEAEKEFSPLEDWTYGEVNTLVVHFRGQPAALGSAGTLPQCRGYRHLEHHG
jgi:hypothetical protein